MTDNVTVAMLICIYKNHWEWDDWDSGFPNGASKVHNLKIFIYS